MYAVSEAAPFIKTGGLADVANALPKAIKELGADIRVVLPKYRLLPDEYARELYHVAHFPVYLGWREQYCGIEKLERDGITYYFIDNEFYFYRQYVYGTTCDDECERFAFFNRAVLNFLPHIDFFPDIIHCNDWQTAMIPFLLRTDYSGDERYDGIKTVFTIHNLKFQGIFPFDTVADLLSVHHRYFTMDQLEFYGAVSFMKAALKYADRLTTVSPTYAKEIMTPFFGEKLDGVLREREGDLVGILNGLPGDMYSPERDKLIAKTYSRKRMGGKVECKMALAKELGFADPSAPIIAMVTRLTEQKGLDLVVRVLDEILNTGANMVILGTGDEKYMRAFGEAARQRPGRFAFIADHNEALAHRIYAGSDIYLMPSLFEPCGISQLIAMKYGSVPIVRETGGLLDTVLPYNQYTGAGDGFSFLKYNAHDMLFTIERAVSCMKNSEIWQALVNNAMSADFSFYNSAVRYFAIYERLASE